MIIAWGLVEIFPNLKWNANVHSGCTFLRITLQVYMFRLRSKLTSLESLPSEVAFVKGGPHVLMTTGRNLKAAFFLCSDSFPCALHKNIAKTTKEKQPDMPAMLLEITAERTWNSAAIPEFPQSVCARSRDGNAVRNVTTVWRQSLWLFSRDDNILVIIRD